MERVGAGQAIDQLDFLGEAERRHLRVIAADLRRRSSVLFCGAGLSFNARRKDGSDRPLPGWWKLTEELAGELPGVGAGDSALRVADLYEAAFGRTRLIERLQSLIPDQEYEPGEVHELIPLMGFREIITTNFDTLIERAFRALRVNPRVVVSGQDLVTSRPPRVLKINGCFDRNPHGVVITGEDFRKYDDERPLLVSFLTNCFVESLVLFIGFSLDDPAFREIFGRVRDLLGRNVRLAYSIQGPVPRSQMGFWEERGLNIISLYSGDEREELTFSDRLRLVLRALLEEAKEDLFTPIPTEPARERLGGIARGPAHQALRGWLWEEPEAEPQEASPPAEEADGAEAGPTLAPGRAWADALEDARHHPRMALAALLPPAVWSTLMSGGVASEGLVDAVFDRPGAWGLTLSDSELGQVRGSLDFLRHAVGGAVTWQRQVARLLSALLAERFHPLKGAAGAAGIPWCRQIMLELAASVDPPEGPLGVLAPALLPEIPLLLMQVYLLAWIEEADDAEAAARARLRLRRAGRLLDVRCLAAPDAARQRDAVILFLSFGASEDVELVLDLLTGRPAEERLEARLRARSAVWRSAPMVGRGRAADSPTPRGAADAEGALAPDVASRIRDLAPDFQFRFIAFHRDPSRHQDLYGTALDWIREQVFTDLTPWEDPHKLNLVYRHHDLYQDYGDRSPGQMDWPFHKQVQDQLVALHQRSESRRLHKVGPHARVREILHDLLVNLGRGKALHVMPPPHIDLAWEAGATSLGSRIRQSVPWELLIQLSLPADGPDLIEARGALLAELLERSLVDLDFLFSLWAQRLEGGAFGGLDHAQRDGTPIEDQGGMGRSLAALASFLRVCVERREWDAERDRGLLLQLVTLVRSLLDHHYDHPHVHTHAVAVLAHLSRLAPVKEVAEVIQGWMARGASSRRHTSLGLGDMDWARIMGDAEALPPPGDAGAFHLTRQLLARALSPLERRTDMGRDLLRWALALYALDRKGRARGDDDAFQLPRDVRLLIQDHLARLLVEEAGQPSLAWLSLARQVREAGVELNPRLLRPDGPAGGDPLLSFVETWCCALPGDPRLLKDWHWTLSSCLSCLEPFIPRDLASLAPGEAPGSRLVAFILSHLDPAPPAREWEGPGLAPWEPDRWDVKRVGAVASYVSILLHRSRGAPAAEVHRGALVELLSRLIARGATGEGNPGRVVDLLPAAAVDQAERNHRAAILAGNPEQQADGVARATRFLELAGRAPGGRGQLPQLEAQLILAAAGNSRPRRDRAVRWLVERLTRREPGAFVRRHDQSLRTLRAVMAATALPRPPEASLRLAALLDERLA